MRNRNKLRTQPTTMPAPSASAAIYARVSTEEQTTAEQVAALRDAAARMRLDVARVIEETGSGARDDRPGLVALMEAARRREVAAVLVWKMDRLGRSLLDLARNVDELRRLGVRLVAVTQGIDLDPERDDPAARFAANVLAAAAEYELALIRERTRLGLAAARKRGVRLGRPRASPVKVAAAVERVRQGASIREAADAVGLGYGTIRRALAG